MSPTLLATKLYIPPASKNLVSRPRLVQILDEAWQQDKKLILVSAPAGYGKTTLVTEWLRGLEARIAWLSLEKADNDPARFLAYLIAALGLIDGSLGQNTRAMLQSPQPLPPEVVLTTLINEIAGVITPFILALDDYHVIEAMPIHQQLDFLVEHQPPQMHLVIITREDPSLPLARLRARGQMAEIRQDDLRFSLEECADFLQRIMGIDLSVDDLAALEHRTEGWIAGLQLAALSMQGRADLPGFIQAFTGSSRFILDYLVGEVFERQSPGVKDFLLKTSILERLSGPLCDAVTGKTASQELLEALEQANLFIVPLDQSRFWYRYHRLFAELLRHRLRVSHPNLELELHQRASRWFEAEGLPVEAIQHAQAAQDWIHAARLIQSATPDFLKRGEVLTVVGWFQSLPNAMLSSDPGLCFSYCWPLLLLGQFEQAAPLLDRLEAGAEGMPDLLGEIYAAQAYLARVLGDHARTIERSQRALELLPISSVNSRGIVALNLGLDYWHTGMMGAAEIVLAEALEAAQATRNHYAALTATIFLGRVFAVRGQLRQAEPYFKRAVQQGKEMPVNALAHMDLATLHYEWNELEESDQHLQKAIDLCQRSHNEEVLTGCWLLSSRLRIAQGDMAGAEEALEQAWALTRAGKISAPMTERVYVAQAYLLMEKGESAREWGQKLTDQVDCHTFYRFMGVTKARCLPDDQARAYLVGLSQVAQANEWGYGLVAIRLLQASLAETQEDALVYLNEALQRADGCGFIRAFMEVGNKLLPLLRTAAGRGVSPAYARRILAAMTGKTAAETGMASLIEPLSERELEVLRLMAAGMSNREIAAKLVISTGTAKSHVHNLCGKLGVRNRTEAAMKAKELGIA